jgi:hypothetical protein
MGQIGLSDSPRSFLIISWLYVASQRMKKCDPCPYVNEVATGPLGLLHDVFPEPEERQAILCEN